jgi:predicted transcriptional regulator
LEDKVNAKLDKLSVRIDSMRNWMIGLVISMFIGFATQSAVMFNMLKP